MRFSYRALLCFTWSLTSLFADTISEQIQRTSASDNDLYRQCCQTAAEDDACFAEFKRDPRYIPILEHLGRCTGVPYLNIIREQTPEFLDNIETFRKNDLFGHPRTDYYEEIGTISTTTLRYMKVASDLKMRFGPSLNQMSIVEIGGGYGGQCLVLSYICQFKSYTIVDLPEVIALTKKYLAKHQVSNVIFKTYEEMEFDKSYDLVISNYAYNECFPAMRRKYAEKILKASKHAYLTGDRDELMSELHYFGIPYKELAEVPLTSPNNVIVIW